LIRGEEDDQETAGKDKVVENRDGRKRVGMLPKEKRRGGGGGGGGGGREGGGGRGKGSRRYFDKVQGKGGTKEYANIIERASIGVLFGVGGEEGGELPVGTDCGG